MSDEKDEDRLEELLLQYTYYYGLRRSQNDKKRVYGYISDSYKEMGYEVNFGRMLLGLVRVGYCVAGDLSTAKHVYIAPLNTLNKTYFKRYRYYPFNEKNTQHNTTAASIVDFLFGFTAVLIGFILVFHFTRIAWAGVVGGLALYAIYMFTLKGIMTFSPSAGLALMHYLALHDKKKDDAYVFLDRCVDNYVPLRTFLIKYKDDLESPRRGAKDGAQVYFLNNLAHSDNLVFASDREDEQLSGLIEECGAEHIVLTGDNVPHCLEASDKLVFITAADIDKKGRYYVDKIRCKLDKTMNVKRLKKIAGGFLQA